MSWTWAVMTHEDLGIEECMCLQINHARASQM